MSEYKGYTKAHGQAAMKYRKTHRENLNLDLPIGTKQKWKEQAKTKGFNSLTAYMQALIEKDS